jgi:TPR repeat protein
MGNKNAMNNLASIYEKGNGIIPKNLSLAIFYYYSSMQLKDMNSQIKFVDLINRCNVRWKPEYHIYWPKSDKLNPQIFVLLLLSKFRNKFEKHLQFDLSFLSKVVTINIISYLSHFEKINKIIFLINIFF